MFGFGIPSHGSVNTTKSMKMIVCTGDKKPVADASDATRTAVRASISACGMYHVRAEAMAVSDDVLT